MPLSPSSRTVFPVDVDRAGLPADDAQELKEAVADAIVERTFRVVSGEGSFGAAVYGTKPSLSLVSGFLLPRFDRVGDEESSDISISTHGLDVRVLGDSAGVIQIRPMLNVYVRALPTVDEIFDLRLALRPKPRLRPEALSRVRTLLQARAAVEIPENTRGVERQRLRRDILSKIFADMGIVVRADAIATDDKRGDDSEQRLDGEGTQTGFEDENLKIPDDLAVQQEIPEKYTRLSVDSPTLILSLPLQEATWKTAIEEFNSRLRQSIDLAFQEWISSEQGLLWSWRPQRAPASAFWSRDTWQKFLDLVRGTPPSLSQVHPGMQARLLVEPLEDPAEPRLFTVRFALENLQEGNAELENGLFQVRLGLVVPKQSVRFMSMEQIKPSYHLSGFLKIPAIGVNGGVNHIETPQNLELVSTWAPRFAMPRIRPTEIAGVPLEYAQLSDQTTNVSDLRRLLSAMDSWISDTRANTRLFESDETPNSTTQDREKNRFNQDITAWISERNRIEKGIAVLERSQIAYRTSPTSSLAIPYRAWIATNSAFLHAAKSPDPRWRLFQLGFILSHLPTIASRLPSFSDFFDEEFDENQVSLLFMNTGGGKSEAFFGVLIYALFLDRLRGKKRGVTAMLHYPLRLLTLQQAQRLMRLLAKAEMIRNDSGFEGAIFEIGFWVGSGNTPNSTTIGDTDRLTDAAQHIPSWEHPDHEDEDKLRAASPAYAAKADAFNKLPVCPFCSKVGTVLRIFPDRKNRLGIVCLDAECEWNRRDDHRGKTTPLPFLLVDMDIYRNAPSVLLGTIDKLALIGNSPQTINRIAGMFGLGPLPKDAPAKDFAPFAPKAGREQTESQIAPPAVPRHGDDSFFDPFPSLIIQDELHLLEESLGTFGGLFETTLFAWFEEISKILGERAVRVPGQPSRPRLPKIIAATATISDPERQIKVLYQRNAVQFPHPGPKLYRSFYSAPARFESGGDAEAKRTFAALMPREQEMNAPWARVYVTMLTNGRPHTATAIAILSAFSVGITYFLRALTSSEPARQDAAVAQLLDSLSQSDLTPRHRAILEKYRASGRYDILANLVDLHRIALTYVTNKKGGDQILSALASQTPRDHQRFGPECSIRDFRMELISGGVDIKTIQRVIEVAEKIHDLGAEDVEDTLRCIVATSAISHGVDVDRFNSMFFAGMPSDIAEFIQASSRIGRAHVGFSILIPTPQNRRDRFIVEVHEIFHRFLERMIAPPAIERWADKAIARVVPSLFQTYFAGVLYQHDLWSASDLERGRVRFPATVNAILDILSGARRSSILEGCLKFMERAVGIDALVNRPNSPDYYRGLLRREVNRIVAEIESGKYGSDLRRFWESEYHNLNRPMTSLRDVDTAGEIFGAANTPKGLINSNRLAGAMSMIRNRRVSGSRSAAATGELDTEIDAAGD